MIRLNTSEPGFEAAFAALLHDSRDTTANVTAPVAAILADVRARGDAAVIDATSRFDRLDLTPATMRVTTAEIDAASAGIDPTLAAALDLAATRIEAFHRAQMPQNLEMKDDAGLTLGVRWGPLDAMGLYVPGGKAAYPSSVLMNALPARVAGVGRIAMCVPCPGGVLNPVVLAAAADCPARDIYAAARVSEAKLVAMAAADTAARAAIQVHGAMGYSWEVDVHLFLKRALALTHAWGTPHFHRRRVAARVFTRPTGPDTTFAREGHDA